jgi:aminoglycoside 6'-N-acetyltransferase
MPYRFEPFTRADYPLIRDWLARPHIEGWWGDAQTEIALIEEEMETGSTDMRLVWHQPTGRPFAYVQDYDAHHWPMPHYADLPAGSRAMDTFLGDPAYLGQGHAGAYLRARADQLLAAGAPCVVVDPDPRNLRAVAAYARAGFVGERIAPCEDGDPVRIMCRTRRQEGPFPPDMT